MRRAVHAGRRLLPIALLGAGVVGCAGSAPPPEIDLAAAEAVPPRLVPPREATEIARTLEPTGSEMGTMWTFEDAPLDRWEETYGFRPSAEWLEHARLSSLRFGSFCSASFVSPDGLVMTNHHCARSCVDAVARPGEDFLGEGFLAHKRADERRCPGLHLDQLVAVTDVTERLVAGEDGRTAAERAEAIEMLSGEMEADCGSGSDRVCQVVPLYHGGRYMLYEYDRYSDVRLVFAPELDIGFFGGDSDNFTYPRYNLDLAFVRAYGESGGPAESEHSFEWNPEGAVEGDPVFVTGHPGSTSRQITVSQFMYEREIRHPLLLEFFDQRLEVFRAVTDPDDARRLSNAVFSLENSQKLFRGELAGLQSASLLAKKIRWERDLRDRIAADPAAARRNVGLWDGIAELQATKARLYPAVVIDNTDNFFASEHLRLAAAINAWVDQATLPPADRAAPFKGEAGEAARRQIVEAGAIDTERSAALLAGRMAAARRWLSPTDPLAAAVRPGETPLEAAERLIASSRLGDADFRRRALGLDPDALIELGDPMLDLARAVRAAGDAATTEMATLVELEAAAAERLAGAIFTAYGTGLPPDATSTLRISDGVVARYDFNGTIAPPTTSIFGLYARASDFDAEKPWKLPPSWIDAHGRIDMATPLNFVSTNDITGGNSGSPVIDREGRIVGLVFDTNAESFPHEFVFGAPGGRTVSVHSAGILEALRVVYGAERLIQELLSGR